LNNVTHIENCPQMSILSNIYSIVITYEQTDFSHYEIHIRIYILGWMWSIFLSFLARRFWYSLLINLFILVECMSILQQTTFVAFCVCPWCSSVQHSCKCFQIVCLIDCSTSYFACERMREISTYFVIVGNIVMQKELQIKH
jgi:hypothetical protein